MLRFFLSLKQRICFLIYGLILKLGGLIFNLTFLPLINHVILGAGFARVVVQLAIKFSPTTNRRFLNMILGGPVCFTVS